MTIETTIMLELDRIIQGNSLTTLKALPDSCINLIFTSPPYADNRKKTYKGIPIKEYVNWFSPISSELKRVLKNDGTFILNIKETRKRMKNFIKNTLK